MSDDLSNFIIFEAAVVIIFGVFGIMALWADWYERRSLKKQQELDRELEDFWRDK